jgi:hypothetical protein
MQAEQRRLREGNFVKETRAAAAAPKILASEALMTATVLRLDLGLEAASETGTVTTRALVERQKHGELSTRVPASEQPRLADPAI